MSVVGGLRPADVIGHAPGVNSEQADSLVEGITHWARLEPSIRALALAGSWARGAAQPESDLDVLVLADPIEPWVQSDQWLRELAAMLGFRIDVVDLERWGVALSWRAWLAADVELELTFARPEWAAVDPIDEGSRRVVQDGLRVMVDKDGRLKRLQAVVVEGR